MVVGHHAGVPVDRHRRHLTIQRPHLRRRRSGRASGRSGRPPGRRGRTRADRRSIALSLMYSAWAHTSGIAPRSVHRATATLSGLAALVPNLLGNQSDPDRMALHRRQIRAGIAAGRQLIVSALGGQQRPRPADAGSIVGGAVGALSVAIVVVAPPAGSARRGHLQHLIDHPASNRRQSDRSRSAPRSGPARESRHRRCRAPDIVPHLLEAGSPAPPSRDRHLRFRWWQG